MRGRAYNLFLLCNNFMHGGSERQFVEVVTRIDPRRFRVAVGCLARRGSFLERLREHGCEIHEFSIGSLKSIRAAQQCVRLARLLRYRRTDLVHAFDFYTNILAVPAARLAHVPVVLATRRDTGDSGVLAAQPNGSSPSIHQWLLRQIFRAADGVVANSEAARRGLVSEGLRESQVRLIRNGVNLDLFSAQRNGTELRRQMGFDESTLLVATVACLRPEKNHEGLIAAIPAVMQRVRAARFLFVGSGPLEVKLRAMVKARGLEEYVAFLGDRSDVPAVLKAVDLFVLPSLAESLSNAIIEAMSAGRPVVAHDVGGNGELVEPGRTGFLVPPGETRLLADRIAFLLERPTLREQMGKRARARAEAEFDIQKSVQRFEALYAELLEGKVVD